MEKRITMFFVSLFMWFAPAYAGDAQEVHVSTGGKPHLRVRIGRVTESGEIIETSSPDINPRSPYPYPLYKSDSGLVMQREVCDQAGKCSTTALVDDWIERGYNRQEYRFDPGALARTKLFCAKGNWRARTTYKFNMSEQGHNHPGMPLPPLEINISTDAAVPRLWQAAPSPIVSPEMSGNTTYYFWVKLPEFSAVLDEEFSATGSCSAEQSDILSVEFWGLIELPKKNQWFLADKGAPGSADKHPNAHYGTQFIVNALISIAKEYRAAFPDAESIKIDAMSLPNGGIIDVNGDWKRPFYGHASGIDADISKWRVPAGNRRKLLEIMCKHADTYLEQDVPGQPPYFHIRVPDEYAASVLESFARAPKTTVKCCAGTKSDPSTMDVCIRDDSRR